jgi:hypothetical protein
MLKGVIPDKKYNQNVFDRIINEYEYKELQNIINNFNIISI